MIARVGQHLRLERSISGFVARLSTEPRLPHCPAVDVLFESVANECAAVVAVVLTGMGDDGLRGVRVLSAQGAMVLTEAIRQAGLSKKEAVIELMAETIVSVL
jgi:two-component system, chemotaxis family, protein-glutamate methylesterase/glutaminase